MNKPVVIIGIGEMAGVFARGLLRSGYPVYPITRDMDMHAVAAEIPQPALVLVAVAEKDLQHCLQDLPHDWRRHTLLLQNELLPRDWSAHALIDPTIISVWFEKKPGQDFKVLIPSPVHGPGAELIQQALAAMTIPSRVLATENDLLHELVLKNVYILTTNIAGLVTGGTVSELWQQHQSLAQTVANEVMDIQESLIGQTLDREAMLRDMLIAFDGDPQHQCMGRSAPARLQRALSLADDAGLAVPECRGIQSQQ